MDKPPIDIVDESSEESFPASDSPARTVVSGAVPDPDPLNEQRPEIPVENNAAKHRFEATLNEHVAFLDYRHRADGVLVLIHTEVPEALQGAGVGGRLARAALEYARAQHERVHVRCPFVASYIASHPEFQSLVIT
jgi:predicted GNAT family acetyltransferase